MISQLFCHVIWYTVVKKSTVSILINVDFNSVVSQIYCKLRSKLQQMHSLFVGFNITYLEVIPRKNVPCFTFRLRSTTLCYDIDLELFHAVLLV